MEDRYDEAVAALRDSIKEYEGTAHQEVAATAAACFLDGAPNFLPFGEDKPAELVARTLFLAATVLVMVKESTEVDVNHLMEVDEQSESCEDEACELDHEDVNFDYINGLIDGLDSMIAAIVGMALAQVELAAPVDFDQIDWSAPSDGTAPEQ